uniref:thioredoxin fold domain-containing protein n=1 Tax=Pedobacter schmidteae TaxID=2201271 RepID=UPI000EABDED9|nr:thioredoxin fold domain-containing protein [Pedobacter schmidteae]
MKKYIIMLLVLISGPVVNACAQGIEFNHGSWVEIKAQAKKENKLIFLDFYTVWCAPCKKMAMEIFPLPEVGAFYNQHFINVKVDAEKGEGIILAKTYRPSGFPTLVFTDAEGKQLYRTTGAENAAELINHGKVALNPQEDYELLKAKFAKNELGKPDLYRYLIMAKAKDKPKAVNEIFDRYFGLTKLKGKEIFAMMAEYVNSSEAKSFKYLQQHRNDFYQTSGKKAVDDYMKKVLIREFSERFFYYDKQEPVDRYLAEKAILKKKVSLTEKDELELDKSYYQHIKDEDHFIQTAALLMKKYSYKNDEEISMIIGGAYLVKKQENLLLLKKWAEVAVALKNNTINYLGLAMICDQLNDKDNALKYIELCLAASKRDDDGKQDMIGQFKQKIVKHYENQGIMFSHGTWTEIKAMAKVRNKLIFVDFYTDWCAPCKQMTLNVFPQKEAGDFYNSNFISYKINAEKGEGPAIAKAYKVSGYPTLAYINSNGEVVHRLTSSTDVKELIEHGKMALNPRGDYEQLKAKFATNELGREDMYRYFVMVKTKGDDKETKAVFDRYFDAVAKIDAETFNLIAENVSSTGDKPLQYLESHVNDFSRVIGKEKVESYIRKLYVGEFQSNVWYKAYKDVAAYEAAKTALNHKINLTEKEALTFDTDFYLRMEDEDNYILKAKKMVETYYYNDDFQISNVLGVGSRLVKQEKNILMMKEWAERALFLKNNFINNATLAIVYKNLKNKPMAIRYIDIAIEQCKQEKNGYEERAEMIKKEIEEAGY